MLRRRSILLAAFLCAIAAAAVSAQPRATQAPEASGDEAAPAVLSELRRLRGEVKRLSLTLAHTQLKIEQLRLEMEENNLKNQLQQKQDQAEQLKAGRQQLSESLSEVESELQTEKDESRLPYLQAERQDLIEAQSYHQREESSARQTALDLTERLGSLREKLSELAAKLQRLDREMSQFSIPPRYTQ